MLIGPNKGESLRLVRQKLKVKTQLCKSAAYCSSATLIHQCCRKEKSKRSIVFVCFFRIVALIPSIKLTWLFIFIPISLSSQ